MPGVVPGDGPGVSPGAGLFLAKVGGVVLGADVWKVGLEEGVGLGEGGVGGVLG